MRILCFGIAKEIIKSDELIISEDSIQNVADLKNWLNEHYPSFNSLASVMIAVNQQYAEDHESVGEDDEIAIIPPVAGG